MNDKLITKYVKKLNENTFSATTEIDLNKPTDEDILRIAISSELSAINLYNRLAKETKNKKLSKILLDVAKEEKLHVGEFESLLNDIDSEQKDASSEGDTEVKNFNYK